MARCLVVMPDGEARDMVMGSLRAAGIEARAVESLARATRAMGEVTQVVVLGMAAAADGLPGSIARLQEGHPWRAVPVVVLSQGTAAEEEIEALRAGAEDWVPTGRPGDVLAARVARLLERPPGWGSRIPDHDDGLLAVRFAAREVRVEGRRVPLTPTEFKLIAHLVREVGRAVSRDELLRVALGMGRSGSSRTVDAHIARLRRKLGPAGERVLTVRGHGYAYRA